MIETNVKPLRVALVGAGGTGKSTLLSLFQKDGWAVFPSITREFYDLMKIKGQKEYMTLPTDEQASFQRKMRNFYQARYTKFIAEHPNEDTVTDRSIFDHMAYGIYNLHKQHSIQQIRSLLDTCVGFANTAYTDLIYVPYPQPWQDETQLKDGFREVEPAQDYSVAALMFYSIFYPKVVQQKLKPSFSPLYISEASPEENYRLIQNILSQAQQNRQTVKEHLNG